MRFNLLKSSLKTAVLATTILLLGAGMAVAQSVSLTAAPTTLVTPDGASVPMWGYTCGAVSGATCTKLNPTATGWSPIVITVAPGPLTVTLTNSLPATVPTSLTIVGQLGGGLGFPKSVPGPVHADQTLTWPVAGAAGDPTNHPPAQADRVQSFGTEVVTGATTALPSWASLRPGTYLLESGTHPSIQGPMGLYGILVVTDAANKIAYPAAGAIPAVTYGADLPLLLSEIDPAQNAAVAKAVSLPGFTETKVWSGQPGGCGNASTANSGNCYPPTVNYSPRYYMVNGVAFDKTKSTASLFPASPATGATGTVLVRIVNAGLHMHVPSIVGSLTGTAAAPGFSLIAEDGNPLPGLARVQNEVFLAAGKTYDVMINVPAGTVALPFYDRELSLSGNATSRDAGMLAYISVNGAGLPAGAAAVTAIANPDTYNAVIAGQTLTVSDPSKGLLANDVNVYGAQVVGTVAGLTLNPNGTFTYTGPATTFNYCGNGATAGAACSTVTLGAATIEGAGGITTSNKSYTATTATLLSIKSPGILLGDKDAAGYPLTVDPLSLTNVCSDPNAPVAPCVVVDPSGAFNAYGTSGSASVLTFSYKAKNTQGTSSAASTITVHFPVPSNLAVTLRDGIDKTITVSDYRWIIEEDRTFYVDPNCQTNPLPATCPLATPQGTPAIFGTNFHTSYMPVVAQGCTGAQSCETGQTLLGAPTVCDGANGICRPGSQKTAVDPKDVVLDPTKHYYISVLPGDAVDPGHAMGGAQIAPGQTAVTVIVEPESQPPAKVSVFVFEDDHPLNGEHDASGGVDVLSPNEPGLGGFNITILDLVGGSGDPAGQMTYDEFGQPLSNALAGTPDPSNGGIDSCPIVKDPHTGFDGTPLDGGAITGVIPVCPTYESDGTTLSPLGGQAVVNGMPPGRYGIVATPAADRIARGEEWLQTNTLDGGKDHEAFIKVNEPAYFQEFGPAGYHVSIGFANPKFINDQGTVLCSTLTGAAACTHTVTGVITGARMSRTPDQRLYSSGNRDTFAYTQCYVSLGSPDGADIAFAKCHDDGSFTLTNIPTGDWRVTIFDQWNDQIVDGITTPVRVASGNVDMGEIGSHGWKDNLYTRTFFDLNGDGVSQDNEPGLTFVPTNIRYRDGSISNLNSTDLDGNAGFNEVFPIFNWYVMETDSLRYKTTGIHIINDAGGPVDSSAASSNNGHCGQAGFPSCGNSQSMGTMARTAEDFSVPALLRVPGAVYCDNADCSGFSIANGPGSSSNSTSLSTGRIDPPWVTSYGWQSFMGQNQLIEFGKKPFADGENGGIRGHVVYASTRPFDDPALLLQLTWEPMVPHVQINLYKEGFAADKVTPTLTLVDHTETSSFDDYAQGFRTDGVPNMNCPGQSPSDPFYYTIYNQPQLLDLYQSQHAGGTPVTPLPNNSQYKCYDGMHNWNQLQPAPYDGMYYFPSVTSINPATGKPAGTNCIGCTTNPDSTDPYRFGQPMLPAGKYVVEMITPPGYELVKEEDKNILLGDTYEAPVTSEFAGFGNIFIVPDQASVASAFNPNNPLIQTTNFGQPRHEGDTGMVEVFWPCVGEARVVPDFMSLFPQSGQNAPFAGATRNLCDRKEVTLEDQMSVLARFYVFTSTHVASHYTGIISDDFAGEFDPFAPAFGEKFSPPNLPVGIKDWAGNEISRVISDNHGEYNGLTFSTFAVNPPDPSGYIPNMLDLCMNDRGTGVDPDPFYQANYSQFCYVWSFMPGQTAYLDTPVIPTSAFAAEYNHPDCAYPDTTPAIASVTGDAAGPWVSAAGHTLTITSLGIKPVNNYGYSGPSSTTAPFDTKTINRNFGFGAAAGTVSLVGTDGVSHPATVTGWSDSTITINAPTGVPNCSVQQQVQYGGSNAQCGELVITAANGKKSVDTVTVTIGGKAPTVMAGGQTIQSAIDGAKPGDLIVVPPGTYHELLVMWKPVRLQGVGAASVVIDANTHPAGLLLNPWRTRIVCLFGIGLDGRHESWNKSCANWPGLDTTTFTATNSNPQVDRLPLEATVGWDATLNGNLAEQLQEPTLMGAYEGAGITVLSKGVRFPSTGPLANTEFASDTFPTGTALLTNATGTNNCGPNTANAHNPFPSSFQCNPSRIDGLSITNSSQGGGGIFVHAWAHNLEIANNRIYNNQGTLAGGISIGQGEHPDGYVAGGAVANPDPGSCQTSNVTNLQLPYCFDRFVNVHHNWISQNSSEGDELFSATPTGAGGVAFCSGADSYQFNYNWVCGNLSTGDGAGVSHVGFIWDGDIEHNTIIFNQGTNPTTPSNGGGLLVMSAPDTDPTCPGEPDADCSHAYGSVADGIGRNLKINANLILGNAAEAGAGGGVRFQGVNGLEVSTFPTNPSRWYTVTFTNNIVANNVAGWDGGGVSLQDSIGVNMVNNTIIANDATASSGTLFGAFFAPQAGSPTPCPKDAQGGNIPCYPLTSRQPAGVSGAAHSSEFLAALPTTVTCPTGHGAGGTGTGGLTNGACRKASFPILYNDVIWQNRSFNVVVTQPGTGALQSTVALVPSFNQTVTGQCFNSPTTYWDLGLRGDTGPTDHSSGVTYDPKSSVLTSIAGYPGGGSGFKINTASDPTVAHEYCNGSKRPPEAVCRDNNTGLAIPCGFSVPPGTNETNVPNPVFSLTAGATVDEGNNWVNISWGPLSLTHPVTGATLADYSPTAGSPAINYITSANSGTTYTAAPPLDYFNNPRKTNNAVDVGAIESTATALAVVSVTPTSLSFSAVAGTTSASQTLTVTNSGGAPFTGANYAFSASYARPAGGAGGNCGPTLAAASSCTLNVVFSPAAAATGTITGTVTITGSVAVTGSPVSLSGTVTGLTRSATLTPTSHNYGTVTRNCPGTTLAQIAACLLDPTQTFTLTNTGNVNLTGIGQGVLGGANSGAFAKTLLGTTCGVLGNTTLAPGGTCTVTVAFRPQTGQATGVKNATISVTDSAGTQTSTLTGTAN